MKTLNGNLKYDKEKPPEHQLAVAKIQRMFLIVLILLHLVTMLILHKES